MRLRRSFARVALVLTLLAGAGSVGASLAQAQITSGLQDVGSTIKLSATDPRIIAARIINYALGFLGIILVLIVLYAGYLYMTSGGEAEKTNRAKAMIRNAVIGLIIILSAWAIVRFVIDRLLSATGEGGGGTTTGQISGGFGGGGGGGSIFQVQSITPSGSVPIRNVEVKILFSKNVDDSGANLSQIVVLKDGISAVAGTTTAIGSVVIFTPSQPCPAPNADRKCFDADSNFTVKVGASLRSVQGNTLTCGGFAPSCQGTFRTGNLIDTQPPSVSVSFPLDGMSVPQSSLQNVQAHATDDGGISTVEFFEGANSVGVDAPTASTSPLAFDANVQWDTTGAALGSHLLSAAAADIDSNIGKSAGVNVIVRAEHCFNQKLDADVGETGVDCGGDPNSQDYCGACTGGSCTKNSDCSTGICQGGTCVAKPVISAVNPLNGKPGTFVTLEGTNFGYAPGTVTFANGKTAAAPQVCADAGVPTWTNTRVIVAVPNGAEQGPLTILNASSGLMDLTNDDNGPKIPDFLPDNTSYPGLCAIVPSSGLVNAEAEAVGQGFGTSPQKMYFGSTSVPISSFPLWTDARIRFTVPVVNNGPYSVYVSTTAGLSNPAGFTVLEKTTGAAPRLDSVDPAQGPRSEYVTLFGANFGYTVGSVVFTNVQSGLTAVGATDFPAGCSAGFWRDTSIVVKVPSAFTNAQGTDVGAYRIKVQRPDRAESNEQPFSLTSGDPKPGICAIDPAVGPEGTAVKLFGDRFGLAQPTVTFSNNRLANVTSHADQEVDTAVPTGAQTGSVFLTSTTSSNKVQFQVRNCNEDPAICGPADQFQCCGNGVCLAKGATCGTTSLTAEYAWQTSTGLIPIAPRVIEECRPDATPAPTPSPAPWSGRAGGTQAPVDSVMTMRFSRPLDATTVKSPAFHLLKCTATSGDACSKTEDVAYRGPSLVHENDTQDVVTLTPSADLAPNTTYRVTVSTAIKSFGPTGENMEEVTACGTDAAGGTLGYCYTFTTRNSTTPSTVSAVSVIPETYTMHDAGETTKYLSEPLSGDDRCIVLDCKKFDWRWYTGSPGNQDTRADITNTTFNGRVDCEQTGTGFVETGDAPVSVNAALQALNLSAFGRLYVKFVPPHVEAYGPNCDAACSNALVWARFSSALDANTVTTPGNVELRKCRNENCYASEMIPPIGQPGLAVAVALTVPPLTANDTERYVAITPGSLLEAGGFYHVLVKGGPQVPNGIKGKNGVPMDGLNDPHGFQWTFRVKTGEDAFCKIERVDVAPSEKFEERTDGRQAFTSTPYSTPDACDANGQALVQGGGWTWSVADVNIADLFKIRNKLIDADGKLPVGCSGSCLATGAGGVSGKVAMCGNGIIETTDTVFCNNGRTPKGDVCMLLSAGAAAGEECEPSIDGNACDPNTCLWGPVAQVKDGGTCGNGKLDPQVGEACDYGPTCLGGGNATSVPAVPDFTPCLSATDRSACIAAGGTCDMHDYRGCSTNCRNLGSAFGKSTCGNKDTLGDGKSCDDGNTSDGDGCSGVCLHEGSQPVTQLVAVCGNGKLEPGETCEAPALGQPVPSGCDPRTCLHTGTISCTASTDPRCCGNGKIETGEDCDDGNSTKGDGCSSSCLFEGSSAEYVTPAGKFNPSFCGNGIVEQGEQCEAGLDSSAEAQLIGYGTAAPNVANALGKGTGTGDGKIDRTQIGYIVGNGVPDPQTGKMSTQIDATIQNVSGSSTYGLICGNTSESDCGAGFGLDDHGCCRPRPAVQVKYPAPGASGVCRNIQVSAHFNEAVNVSSASNNFEVYLQASTCPAGTKEVITDAAKPGFWNAVVRTWQRFASWVTGGNAQAALLWCKGAVTGQMKPIGAGPTAATSTDYAFSLDKALEPNTRYRVRFLGDTDLDDNDVIANKTGVKSAEGVVHPMEVNTPADLVWDFTTGDKICTVNVLEVKDMDPVHPNLFTVAAQTHPFVAQAVSVDNGASSALSPVQEYSWTWLPWSSADESLVTVVNTASPASASAQFTAKNKNGNTVVTAMLRVSADTITNPSTVGATVKGIAPVTVNLCEDPWPVDVQGGAPFRDMFNSPNLQSGPFSGLGADKYFNFSTMYCKDAGAAGDLTDDLPSLQITQVPPTALDAANSILRQYLFVYGSDHPELKKDGIGIRIVSNPQHLSPLEWYASRGFTGTPTSLKVDGYPAIQDGTTVYVAASNRPAGDSGNIYSNIYLISHNPDASAVTTGIADQLVKSLSFNINPNFTNQSNICMIQVGTAGPVPLNYYSATDQRLTLPCTTNADCYMYGGSETNNVYCDSDKAKIARDTIRISDFQNIAGSLERSKDPQGKYPQLLAGSYIKGMTTSLWPSWTKEFGAAVKAPLPTDPVNRYLTCGLCETAQTPCQTKADCPKVNGQDQACLGGRYIGAQGAIAKQGSTAPSGPVQLVWQPNPNIDPQTCWNSQNLQYACPQIGTDGLSTLYQYQSLGGGTQYTLGAMFEIPQAGASWYPKLPDGVWRCVSASTAGQLCVGTDGVGHDSLCAGPSRCSISGSLCTTNADCPAVSGQPQTCAVPRTQAGSCRQLGGSFTYDSICTNLPQSDTGTCGDGVLNSNETCELNQTDPTPVACTVSGVPGTRQRTCDACKNWVENPNAVCVATSLCGNGRLDATETCDDGVLNGTYGHCNKSCNGYAGYCGDGLISPGEVCDEGGLNGVWSSNASGAHCSSDCKSLTGPYCGDQVVNGNEQCDGNLGKSKSALCTKGTVGVECATNSDCGANGTCGGGSSFSGYVKADGSSTSVRQYDSCQGIFQMVGGIARETQHLRTCDTPDSDTNTQCQWLDWSWCKPIGVCGDGIKDANEECDSGSGNSDTGACTTQCKKNICGDGNIFKGTEECDNGSSNGIPTCLAEYNSTCMSCGHNCKFQPISGGYCGDQVKNGAEQCDSQDGLDVACNQIGYDYAADANGVQCSSSCTYANCLKCSDVTGDGRIEGRVYDAVFQQVVPNARVTLLYNGVQTDQTFTDENGYFTFTKVNTNPVCVNYRLVVDMYDDNVCTNMSHPGTNCYAPSVPPFVYPYDVNEGLLGGYFSFVSDPFYYNGLAAVMSGKDQDGVTHIDIYPRPERGKAYVAVTWKSQTSGMPYRIHTVMPTADAFTAVNFKNNETSQSCDYSKRPATSHECTRDLYGFRGVVGDSDLQNIPYGRLTCLHRAGEKVTIWYEPNACSTTNKCADGCPLEGINACLLNTGSGKTYDSCLTTPTDPSCVACAADGKHACFDSSIGQTADTSKLDDCSEPSLYGPLSSYVNYAPLANQADPVGFYLTSGPGGSGSFTSDIGSSNWNFVAFAAITSFNGDARIIPLAKPTGSGWIWHIADLDVQNELFTPTNEIIGTDKDQDTVAVEASKGKTNTTVPIPGFATWTYEFQGSNSYCLNKTTKLLNPSEPRMCITQSEKDACNATSGYACSTMDAKYFSQFNY